MASSPNIPDSNEAARQGAFQDLANYPFRAQIDALAQMGGKATINGKTYDFTGLGNAAQDYKLSDKMAQAMLDIQRNYGPGYIKQRLADLQQSDPAGYAARKQLFDKIISDAEANPDRPMAEDTQKQVMDLLSQGSNLSTGPGSETEAVQQGIRGKQLKNGIFLGNAPVSEEASALVNAGDQMQQKREQKALGFLQSGISPEDVTYRRIQQSLSNLGNAINGQSPVAQFASLSGAQQGAAPFDPGNVQMPGLNPNAGLQGMQNAANIYSGKVNWAENQANPWTAGISSAANTVGALNQMGLFNSSRGYTNPTPQSYAASGGVMPYSTASASTSAGQQQLGDILTGKLY